MSSVSLAESAALLLPYLEGNGFCKTAGTFRREARKLLASIVTPSSVKSLDTILNEYVQIKEAEIKRKQLAEAIPLVNDLLAVIDQHVGQSASQPNEMLHPAEAWHKQQSHQPVATSRQEDAVNDTAGVQACQQPMAQMASTAAEKNATPMCQKPPLPLPALASRHPSTSQHRKGAPRRRVEQSNKVSSPISRVTVLAPGSAAQGASANTWMDLPMTDDGLSSLMHDDAFQQRFAEGLATHLTSGADLHSSISHQYDDVLAGLPADPNMAGLLEPLVLPAEAYQIPPHLHRMTCQQDKHHPASTCFMDVQQQPAPSDLSCPGLGRPGPPLAFSHQLALPASRLSLSANQAECTGLPQAHDSNVAVQSDGQQVLASTDQLQLCREAGRQVEHPAMLADPVAHNAKDEQQLCWEQPEQEHEDSVPQDHHMADMLASHEVVCAASLPQHAGRHHATAPARHGMPTNASNVLQEGRAQAQALPAVEAAQQEVQAVRELVAQAAQGRQVHSSGMPATAANTSLAANTTAVTLQAGGQHNTALPDLSSSCRQMVMAGAPALLPNNHPAESQKTASWQHQQQRKHVGAVEQASLDSMYATVFPNRQATQPPTGATQLNSALETVKSNSVQAMQQQGTLPGLSNLHNSKLNNRIAQPVAGQNRKQRQGYATLPAHQQSGSGTPCGSHGPDSSGSDRAVCAFEQHSHSSLDQRLQQAAHKHALDASGNGKQEPGALVWGKKQKRRRASPAESDPAERHASKAHNPAMARVNRVSQGIQQSNPRQVLASLPANQMREVEPQGYLAAPDVVTQSAALDAHPTKVPLQSGISFDPDAIEAFIKSLHERQ
ncbi:hypothetical protein WJX77_000333 [Trebouxia sp. C0004]